MVNRIVFFVLIVLSALSCRKDPVLTNVENCNSFLDSAASAYFSAAANDMAYLDISSDPNHVGHQQFKLDHWTVNFYLSKLAAIYQKASNPADELHDILFTYYVRNNAGPRRYLYGIITRFYGGSAIYEELKNKSDSYTDPFINKIINDYSLYPNAPQNPFSNNTIYFISEVPFNVSYIKNNLDKIDEIQNVWYDNYGMDGSRIIHSKNGKSVVFTFDYGWGDCPSGCFSHHYWDVEVDEDCTVRLLKEYGDELPS